jgi:hypothetical protein
MTTEFRYNVGAGLIKLGLDPPDGPPDPVKAKWFDEGARGETHSGSLVSQQWSGVVLTWEAISLDDYAEIMEWWYDLINVRFKIEAVRVPREDGGVWTDFARVDERGIFVEKPEAEMVGPLTPVVTVRLRRIKRAVESGVPEI